MMREQWIKLEFDAHSGDPDASVVARRFSAILSLLESLDQRGWKIPSPRYRWAITDVSKTNPVAIRLEARLANQDASHIDVIGNLTSGLMALEKTPDPKLLEDTFDRRDLTAITKLVSRQREPKLAMRLQYQDNGQVVSYSPSHSVRKHARALLKTEAKSPPDEYVTRRGRLNTITASKTEKLFGDDFILEDQETGEQIDCFFHPSDRSIIGAHVGNELHVEGLLEYPPPGSPKKARLRVEAFQLIPKGPALSLEELHRHKLRIPGDRTSEEYIRDLRADLG